MRGKYFRSKIDTNIQIEKKTRLTKHLQQHLFSVVMHIITLDNNFVDGGDLSSAAAMVFNTDPPSFRTATSTPFIEPV